MPVKKMDFRSADKVSVKTKRSPSVGRKKKEAKAADAEKDLTGIPTPKLTRKKKSSVGAKDEPKVEEKKEETPKLLDRVPEKAPEPEPDVEPAPVVEVADGEINIEFDPEERDPDGKWVIVKKPAKISTNEGDDVSCTVTVAKGDPLFLPQVRWIKGKWNEITGGDRYQLTSEETNFTLTFKAPKMSDSGLYTVKVQSKSSVESKTFDLRVGPQRSSGGSIIITRGKLPKDVEKEDADFRGKLKKVQKKQLTKDNEGVKGDIWTKLRDAQPRDYDKLAFMNGIKDHRGMLKRMTNVKKLNKKGRVFAVKLPDTQAYQLGDKIVLECETANEAVNVRWYQNGVELKDSKRAKIEKMKCYHKLTIDAALMSDDCCFTAQTAEDKTACEVFIHSPLVTAVKPFDDLQVVEGEDAHFFARISADDGQVKLSKDGIEVGAEVERIKLVKEKSNITLDIVKVTKDDAGFYELITNGGKTFGELIVIPKPIVFNSVFSDLSVGVNDKAEFACEVADEALEGVWMRNGKKINEGDRVKIVADGKSRSLVIEQVSTADEGEYEYRVEGSETLRLQACLTMKEAQSYLPVKVTIEKSKVAPKIMLNLSDDRTVSTKAGNKLALEVPLGSGAVAPLPAIQWSIGDVKLEPEKEAEKTEYNSPLDKPFDKPFKKPDGAKQRVRIVNKSDSTALVLPNAAKCDAGVYTLTLTSEEGTATVDINVKVIDKPGPPGIPIISELNNECCRVDWTPPQDQGGAQITGYFLERKKVTSERWVRLNTKLHEFHNYLARRMVEGNRYQIRVTAVNDCGSGEPSALSESFMPLAPTSEVTQLKTGKLTDDSIELKWMSPEEQGPVPMSGYIVQFQLLSNEQAAAGADFDMNQVDDDAWNDWSRKINPDANNANLDGLETGKSYLFRIATQNAAGKSKWTTLGPIVCAHEIIDPRVIVPRALTRLIQVPVGQKLHLNIQYEGAPKPEVYWKFKEGLPVEGEPDERPERDLEGHVTVRTNEDSSVLFVRESNRWDTGSYIMNVQVGEKCARASFNVAIVEAPTKPRALKIVEVIGCSVQLTWQEPKDDGNNEIIGYQVEKRDKRSGDEGMWYVVHERIRHCKCSVDDLILGNEFQFRVKAFNEFGLSEGIFTKDFAVIEKEVITYEKPVYQEHNYNTKPKFTMPLNNRKLTVGYTGTLTCSVKAVPRATIRWFKNKIEIIDNPKYKMSWGLGVCQLEIRRPRLGDAGTYTCLAENSEGSDSVDCTVLVREAK